MFKSLARLSYTSFTFLSVYFFWFVAFCQLVFCIQGQNFSNTLEETHTKKFEGGRVSLEFKKVWNFLCKGITDVVSDKIKKQWYYFEGIFLEKLIPIQIAMDGILFRPMYGNIQDAVDSRFYALNSSLCQWNLESGLQSIMRFCIPRAVFRIPKSRIPDSTGKNFPHSFLHGAKCYEKDLLFQDPRLLTVLLEDWIK